MYERKALGEQSPPLTFSSRIPEVNNLPLGQNPVCVCWVGGSGEGNTPRLGGRPGFQLSFVPTLQCVLTKSLPFSEPQFSLWKMRDLDQDAFKDI